MLTNENIKEALAYGVKNNILGQTINLDIQLVKRFNNKKEINKLILDRFPTIYRPTAINFVDDKQYNHRFKKFRNNKKRNNNFFFQLTYFLKII